MSINALFFLLQKHPPTLSYDEVTTVRKNLQRINVDVDMEYIKETWHPVYRRYKHSYHWHFRHFLLIDTFILRFFLNQALSKAFDCKKLYYLYHQQGNNKEVIKSF